MCLELSSEKGRGKSRKVLVLFSAMVLQKWLKVRISMGVTRTGALESLSLSFRVKPGMSSKVVSTLILSDISDKLKVLSDDFAMSEENLSSSVVNLVPGG